MQGKAVDLLIEHAAGLELAIGTVAFEPMCERVLLASGNKVVEIARNIVGWHPDYAVYAVRQRLIPVVLLGPERKLSIIG